MMRMLLGRVLGLWLVSMAALSQGGEVSAVVSWSQRVELGTLVSGVVAQVRVKPGQPVRSGDVLVALDDRGYASEVARRRAEHRHAQAVLEEAQREDERAVELYDRTVLSDFERNQALIALQAARAVVEQARAALLSARLDLERSAIRAPFDGLVLAVTAVPGQVVVSDLQSMPLVTLADNRRYRLQAEVDLDQAARLQAGQVLRADLRGRLLDARISHVGFEPVDRSAQAPRYELVAEIAVDGEMPLRIGETVVLHLE